MIDLLTTIIIMSLVCCGAHVVIMDSWLGWTDEQILQRKKVWMKPLFLCCRCMASVWGGGTYLLIQLTSHPYDLYIRNIHFYNVGLPILLIIPAILATAFLNSVFINYYYKQA